MTADHGAGADTTAVTVVKKIVTKYGGDRIGAEDTEKMKRTREWSGRW